VYWKEISRGITQCTIGEETSRFGRQKRHFTTIELVIAKISGNVKTSDLGVENISNIRDYVETKCKMAAFAILNRGHFLTR